MIKCNSNIQYVFVCTNTWTTKLLNLVKILPKHSIQHPGRTERDPGCDVAIVPFRNTIQFEDDEYYKADNSCISNVNTTATAAAHKPTYLGTKREGLQLFY